MDNSAYVAWLSAKSQHRQTWERNLLPKMYYRAICGYGRIPKLAYKYTCSRCSRSARFLLGKQNWALCDECDQEWSVAFQRHQMEHAGMYERARRMRYKPDAAIHAEVSRKWVAAFQAFLRSR